MENLSIIFANRVDYFEKPGGDTVQMLKTKEHLERLYPVKIHICTKPEEFKNYPDAKIVHIFNLSTINETLAFINEAKKLKKRVALSTIYWNLLDNYYVKYLKFLNLPLVQIPNFMKKITINIFNLFIILNPFLWKKLNFYFDKGLFGSRKYFSTRRKALQLTDLYLPNSIEEMNLLFRDFKLNSSDFIRKTVVVPNATEILKSDDETDNHYNLPSNYVMIAGRIEPAKNQYNVLKALYHCKEIPVVIVGEAQSQKTYKKLERMAKKRGNIFLLPHVQQKNLISLYKNAACHVLPSFCDTTGLVNLEALLCGCPVVVSNANHCPVKFYEFDEYGEVCNPYSPRSIKNAIFKVLNKNQRVKLSDEYKYKISYENVAKLTFEAYLKLVDFKTPIRDKITV